MGVIALKPQVEIYSTRPIKIILIWALVGSVMNLAS